jgi:hypothetical protein
VTRIGEQCLPTIRKKLARDILIELLEEFTHLSLGLVFEVHPEDPHFSAVVCIFLAFLLNSSKLSSLNIMLELLLLF